MQEHKEKYEKERQKLQEWFIKLITEFRKEYGKSIMEFEFPCQVEIFWIKEPCEWQIIVITHDQERSDKEIIIHEPFQGYEFLREIGNILEREERWKKELPKDSKAYLRFLNASMIEELPAGVSIEIPDIEHLTRADIFIRFLSLFLYSSRYSPLFGRKIKGSDAHLMYFSGNSVFFPPNGIVKVFYGNIAELDIQKILETFRDMITTLPDMDFTSEKIADKNGNNYGDITLSFTGARLVGYAAYLYPPVWVYEKPIMSFEDLVLLKPVVSSVPWVEFKIGDLNIEVDNDGKILVLTNSKKTARDILNLIAGLLTIFNKAGLKFFAIRFSDLKEVYYNPENPPGIYLFKSHVPSRECSSVRRYVSRSILSAPYNRPILGIEEINKAVKYAEKIWGNKDLMTSLVFFLEAYSHYFESEYNQAFIMGWTALERLVSLFWQKLWEGKGLSSNRLNDLNKWELLKKLEILELQGIIKAEIYYTIKSLNRKRNNLVHHAESINQGDARRLLETVRTLLMKEIERQVRGLE
ncbi:MAG: hypothetical protein J7K33_03425 [Candidatus Marinimicrobia bacterium]|nr:hypothetical protein [Candidatus Neomarinimicrobiota bacterium]